MIKIFFPPSLSLSLFFFLQQSSIKDHRKETRRVYFFDRANLEGVPSTRKESREGGRKEGRQEGRKEGRKEMLSVFQDPLVSLFVDPFTSTHLRRGSLCQSFHGQEPVLETESYTYTTPYESRGSRVTALPLLLPVRF